MSLTDDNPISLRHATRILRPKVDHPSPELVRPHPDILPGHPRLTTAQPKWPDGPPLAEDAKIDGAPELDVADAAVAAAVTALAPRSAPDSKLAQDAGVASLERLWVGDARVGHVDVHA